MARGFGSRFSLATGPAILKHAMAEEPDRIERSKLRGSYSAAEAGSRAEAPAFSISAAFSSTNRTR